MAFLHRSLSVVLLAAALFPFCRSVSAAESGGGRAFSVLSTGDADWTHFGVMNGSTFVPLTPARQSRSPALAFLAGDAVVNFVHRIPDKETGRLVNTPAARVAWPAGAKRVLFVLIPGVAADGAPTLEVVASDDGPEAFPAESLRVINTTRATFQGVLGRERLVFAPGASAPVGTAEFIPADEEAPDPGMPVGLALATPAGLKTLYAATMSVSPRSRVLVLVCPPRNAGSNRVQVRAIHDVPPVPTGTPLAASGR